jgi:hypothetical protein
MVMDTGMDKMTEDYQMIGNQVFKSYIVPSSACVISVLLFFEDGVPLNFKKILAFKSLISTNCLSLVLTHVGIC